MRLHIVGGGALITSGAGGCLAGIAREKGVAVAATPVASGAIHDDDRLAVGRAVLG